MKFMVEPYISLSRLLRVFGEATESVEIDNNERHENLKLVRSILPYAGSQLTLRSLHSNTCP